MTTSKEVVRRLADKAGFTVTHEGKVEHGMWNQHNNIIKLIDLAITEGVEQERKAPQTSNHISDEWTTYMVMLTASA